MSLATRSDRDRTDTPRSALMTLQLGSWLAATSLLACAVASGQVPKAGQTKKPMQGKAAKPASPGQDMGSKPASPVQKVIAEGSGVTADEALKDSFRNAVRQVVGAVVDAETLVKDDEVITDKVLTYSDGMIKTYEVVSKKQDKGIFRVRIKADVERRSVVTRLKDAQVAVTEVDGEGMFAEIVTQLDAKKDSAGLLTKAFEGYPANVVRAKAIGRPKILGQSDTEVTIAFEVTIDVDPVKYRDVSKRVIPVLEKVALEQGTVHSTASRRTGSNQEMRSVFFDAENSKRLEHCEFLGVLEIDDRQNPLSVTYDMWSHKNPKQKFRVLLYQTNANASDERTTWRWFYIDDVTFLKLGLVIDISLVDKNGEEVPVEQIAFSTSRQPAISVIPIAGDSERRRVAFVSPYFYCKYYCRSMLIPVTAKVTHDQLRALKSIKCAVRPSD